MNPSAFLAHHGIVESPFSAEEARHDPVFSRLMLRTESAHPEYDKVIGSLERPHAAVVFGEKGAGKTALRLLIGERVAQHNEEHARERVLLVGYDDLNPVLDTVARNRHGVGASDPDALLEGIRLPDHQDAILGLAVTKFFDGILGMSGDGEAIRLPADAHDRLRRLPRDRRMDAAVLAVLYDSPRGGNAAGRWRQVRGHLRLGWRLPSFALETLTMLLSVVALGLFSRAGHWAMVRRAGRPAPVVGAGRRGSLRFRGRPRLALLPVAARGGVEPRAPHPAPRRRRSTAPRRSCGWRCARSRSATASTSRGRCRAATARTRATS